jgi:hypothetical protein
MCTNTPTLDIILILGNIMEFNEIPVTLSNDIMFTNLVVTQNYFKFNGTKYIQANRLAMGAPTSPIFAEIFLKRLKHVHVVNILLKHHITGYFRYADNILIVYNADITSTQIVLNEFNSIHNIKLSTEEVNNTINFLDLAIKCYNKQLEFEIVRKHTRMDLIIHYSCHPFEHKLSAVK